MASQGGHAWGTAYNNAVRVLGRWWVNLDVGALTPRLNMAVIDEEEGSKSKEVCDRLMLIRGDGKKIE